MEVHIRHIVVCAALGFALCPSTSVYVCTENEFWHKHYLYHGLVWSDWLSTPPSRRQSRRDFQHLVPFGCLLLDHLRESFEPGLFEIFIVPEEFIPGVFRDLSDAFVRSPALFDNVMLWRRYSQRGSTNQWSALDISGLYSIVYWDALSYLPAPLGLSREYDRFMHYAMRSCGFLDSYINAYHNLRRTHYDERSRL